MKDKETIDRIIDKLAESTRSPKGRYSAGETYKILQNKLFTRSKRLRLIRFSSAAAAVIVLAVFSWGVYNYLASTETLTVSTLAETQNIVLPDGTEVMLNRYTTLNYPKKFRGRNREVSVSGEAYFEVRHDKKHPFIVQTTDIGVEVLGTHFNVEAYPRDRKISTTLFEGSVAVTDNNGQQKVVLTPNEIAVYDKETGIMTQEILDNPSGRIAWRNGDLLFENVTLVEIARELSNAFNVNIEVADEALTTYRMTGKFKNKETFEDILKLLSTVGNFTYETQDQTIYIKESQK